MAFPGGAQLRSSILFPVNRSWLERRIEEVKIDKLRSLELIFPRFAISMGTEGFFGCGNSFFFHLLALLPFVYA